MDLLFFLEGAVRWWLWYRPKGLSICFHPALIELESFRSPAASWRTAGEWGREGHSHQQPVPNLGLGLACSLPSALGVGHLASGLVDLVLCADSGDSSSLLGMSGCISDPVRSALEAPLSGIPQLLQVHNSLLVGFAGFWVSYALSAFRMQVSVL